MDASNNDITRMEFIIEDNHFIKRWWMREAFAAKH